MTRQLELARLLLRKAEEDETVVFSVPDAVGLADSIFGFHCQQAVEKHLKAVLAARGVVYRRTHQVRELMDLVADSGESLPAALADLDEVSPFAVEFRYAEVPVGEEPPIDRGALREKLRALRDWAETQVERAPPG